MRTGTTTEPVLLAFEGTPLIGVSADKVLLQISDAVLVTGSFSIRIGPVRMVDVATGLQSAVPLVGPLAPLNLIPTEDLVADPETDLWRADDYSMIHNLRVNTLEFGASAVTVFLGWAPGLGAYTIDGDEARRRADAGRVQRAHRRRRHHAGLRRRRDRLPDREPRARAAADEPGAADRPDAGAR